MASVSSRGMRWPMSTRRQMHKVSIRARQRKEKKLWAVEGSAQGHRGVWSRRMASLAEGLTQSPNTLSPQRRGGARVRKQKTVSLRLGGSSRRKRSIFHSTGGPGPRIPWRAQRVPRLARTDTERSQETRVATGSCGQVFLNSLRKFMLHSCHNFQSVMRYLKGAT